MAGVLDQLLEGFAAEQTDPVPAAQGEFTAGDQVRVKVGKDSIVGRVRRPHDAAPDSHVVIAPEGGGPHVKAKVSDTSLDTPERNRSEAKRREVEAQQEAAKQGAQLSKLAGRGKMAVGVPSAPAAAQESERTPVTVLLEAFGPPAPSETPAQSQQIAKGQVAAAQKSLAAGWSSAKHPRGAGGKFGYTTGGKRASKGRSASRSSAASSRTLGSGSSGAMVRSLQRQLGVKADGLYGPQTQAAVTRYQQQHGLQVDGVVGRQTLAALRGHSNARSVKPGPIASKVATVKVHASKRSKRAPARPVLTPAQRRAQTKARVAAHPWAISPAAKGAGLRPAGRIGGGTIV